MNARRDSMRRIAMAPLYAALIFFAILTLLPFIWMLSSSIKSQNDFFTSFFLPVGDGFLGIAWDRLTLTNFRRLFAEFPIGRAMLNSFFFASVSSSLRRRLSRSPRRSVPPTASRSKAT